ncbi:hypothetical protein E5676_scaffold367G00060 [Cucumis melo var. makuwa]|uniref:Uncharacterized protein n=1 Tax=Cucumis melo var. makuwa TaxID=1194695 RepID=A0A5A7U2L3_CUCMM|nr:hypothetical protein E6C27_scaffold675G00540 [Cucumis melo var. makuwa]TYK10333.1 hypothetical protein E5676_scaffold367G00060 [Cucumis melo var. makuwa]
MAVKSLKASPIKSASVFIVSIAILAASVTAGRTVSSTTLDPSMSQNLSFFSCAPFIFDVTLCLVDVFKFPISPHPLCCKAIFKLNDCAPVVFQTIPPADMDVIKKICA